MDGDNDIFANGYGMTGAARIGAELRAVREQLGWPLGALAEQLRIRMVYLDAIERGALAELPAVAYQTGFVRAYAQALGLDPDEIIRRFRAEGAGVKVQPALSFPATVPERGVPRGAVVLVALLVLLVAYGLWYRNSQSDREQARMVSTVPAEIVPPAAPKLQAPSKPAGTASQAATPAAQTPSAQTPSAQTPAAQSPTLNPATPPDAPTMEAPAPAGTASSAPSASASSTPAPSAPASSVPAASAPAATPPNGRTLAASADAWVQVKDSTGQILFSKVMHKGDTWPLPDEAGLTLTTGNAGGTEIDTAAAAGAPLGGNGVVLRNYQLTPAASPPAASPPPASPPAAAPASSATPAH